MIALSERIQALILEDQWFKLHTPAADQEIDYFIKHN